MTNTTDQSKSGNSAAANLREGASKLHEGVRDMGNQVREAATEQYEKLRETAAERFEEGRQRARDVERSLEQYVHDKPIQSLLIAAGVGMLIGVLWRRH